MLIVCNLKANHVRFFLKKDLPQIIMNYWSEWDKVSLKPQIRD